SANRFTDTGASEASVASILAVHACHCERNRVQRHEDEHDLLRGDHVALRSRHPDDIPILHAELYNDVTTRAQADSRPWRPIPLIPRCPQTGRLTKTTPRSSQSSPSRRTNSRARRCFGASTSTTAWRTSAWRSVRASEGRGGVSRLSNYSVATGS